MHFGRWPSELSCRECINRDEVAIIRFRDVFPIATNNRINVLAACGVWSWSPLNLRFAIALIGRLGADEVTQCFGIVAVSSFDTLHLTVRLLTRSFGGDACIAFIAMWPQTSSSFSFALRVLSIFVFTSSSGAESVRRCASYQLMFIARLFTCRRAVASPEVHFYK